MNRAKSAKIPKVSESYLSRRGCALHMGGPLINLQKKLAKLDTKTTLFTEFKMAFTSINKESEKEAERNALKKQRENWLKTLDPEYWNAMEPPRTVSHDTKAFLGLF